MSRSAEIIARVADMYGLAKSELVGPSRLQVIAWPRQHAMFLLREAGFSYGQIGRLMGRRHHTTVIHGIAAYDARRAASAQPEASNQALATRRARYANRKLAAQRFAQKDLARWRAIGHSTGASA